MYTKIGNMITHCLHKLTCLVRQPTSLADIPTYKAGYATYFVQQGTCKVETLTYFAKNPTEKVELITYFVDTPTPIVKSATCFVGQPTY
jgi:hypothetical protein